MAYKYYLQYDNTTGNILGYVGADTPPAFAHQLEFDNPPDIRDKKINLSTLQLEADQAQIDARAAAEKLHQLTQVDLDSIRSIRELVLQLATDAGKDTSWLQPKEDEANNLRS